MILFFDTETTGVPKDYNGSPYDLNNWPQFLFGETFDGAHDALADVSATARCYFHLRNNVWNKDELQQP